MRVGKKIVITGFGITKIAIFYLILSYFCKYPNQLIVIPKKTYIFSRRFYDILEVYGKKLFKKSKVVNVVDKGKDIIVEFVDKNVYYDLDDRLNSKFYKTCSVVLAFLIFGLRSYINKKSPGSDQNTETVVNLVNEVVDNIIEND